MKRLALCLAAAWLLALTMASVSVVDAHPDEKFHLAAGAYYLDHWLPPEVSEAALVPSLSSYGFTYLGEIDATYVLAGVVARILPDALPEYLRFRAFNLLLFLVLVVVYWRRRDPFAPFALLLITPQIWYVFSYFNNDALPFFLALLLADVAFAARAPLADAFAGPLCGPKAAWLAGAGILAGLLMLTKSNYLPFLAFMISFAAWKVFGAAIAATGTAMAALYLARTRSFLELSEQTMWRWLGGGAAVVVALVGTKLWRTPVTRSFVVRGALLVAAALAIAGPPLVYDRTINGPGPEKAFALGTIAEKHAVPEYKPSDGGAANSYFGLRLRDKGVALHEVLLPPWSWPVKTWQSFTGYYGYMKIRSPAVYYIAILLVNAALVAYTSRAILRRGEPFERELLAGAALFGGGVVALSFYHSWINDFQAQGRYLFPVLALFAIPFTKSSRLFEGRVVPALLQIAFFLSSLSFVFVALRRIAKVWAA